MHHSNAKINKVCLKIKVKIKLSIRAIEYCNFLETIAIAAAIKICAIVCCFRTLHMIELWGTFIYAYIAIYFKIGNLGTVLACLTIRCTVKMKPIIHITNIFSFVLFSFSVFMHDLMTFVWYWTLDLKFDVHIIFIVPNWKTSKNPFIRKK